MCTAPMQLPPFAPLRWAPGAGLQTLLGGVVGRATPHLDTHAAFERVAVPMQGGDVLEGRFRRGTGATAVLVLHGLGGSSRSLVVRRAAHSAAELGCSVLALDHRGSGGALERTRRPYMTGHDSDVRDALEWLQRASGANELVALGFSLSGNTLLRHVARGAAPRPACAVAISPPIDLESASRTLRHWPARAFEAFVVARCRRWPERYSGAPPREVHARFSRRATLREFDRDYIAPVWGFADRDTYYARASSIDCVHAIETPTHVVIADDDPLAPVGDVRRARWGPGVTVHVTRGGGHLGWIAEDSAGRPRRWLDAALTTFVRSVALRTRDRERSEDSHHVVTAKDEERDTCCAH
jgi:predicted alpha/beta-fold hydrolase